MKGCFLVATPALSDPNFARAVILICDYGKEGCMGLIVNRPLSLELSEILPEGFESPHGKPGIHQGGPVQPDHLLFLHGIPQSGLDDHPVCEGVYLGGDPEILKRVLAGTKAPGFLRCYLGYAGWAAGQLEAEMKQGAWLLRPARAQDVFGADTETLWARMIGSQAGGRLDSSGSPKGPELN